MTNHELKIWPQFYSRVADGSKTFEIRKNDRGFQFGDTVTLREFDPELQIGEDDGFTGIIYTKGNYTKSPPLTFKIGYVLPVDSELVVFSLLNIEGEK